MENSNELLRAKQKFDSKFKQATANYQADQQKLKADKEEIPKLEQKNNELDKQKQANTSRMNELRREVDRLQRQIPVDERELRKVQMEMEQETRKANETMRAAGMQKLKPLR